MCKFSTNFEKRNRTMEAVSHKKREHTLKRSWPKQYLPCLTNSSNSIKKKMIIQRWEMLFFHIFSNANDFEAVFRPPGFDISCVTSTFDLKSYSEIVVFFANYKCCCWKMYVYYWYEIEILRLSEILRLVWCLINLKLMKKMIELSLVWSKSVNNAISEVYL